MENKHKIPCEDCICLPSCINKVGRIIYTSQLDIYKLYNCKILKDYIFKGKPIIESTTDKYFIEINEFYKRLKKGKIK